MKKIDNEQFDVFISYRRRDSTEVQLIHADLTKDYKVFFDQSSIRTGTEYETRILSAIKNSKCLLVILTEDACRDFKEKKSKNEKDWVEEELSYAHEMGIPILPIIYYDEKDYSGAMAMIAELEECAPPKVASFLPGLQQSKIHLDLTTRTNDLKTLTKEFEQFGIKRKVHKRLTKYLLLMVFLVVLVGLFLGIKFWDETSGLSIKSARLDRRVFVEKKIIDKIVSEPSYLDYKATRRGDFDFRGVFYHEETILPKVYEEKINKDIDGYVSFLAKKVEEINKGLIELPTHDEIEISILFFKTLSGETFTQDLTSSQQKVKLKRMFNDKILKLSTLINELKTLSIVKYKQFLRIQVLNRDKRDSLLSNTIRITYKENTYRLYRTKQPMSHQKLLAVPVSSSDAPEESYDEDDFKIIPKDSIVTQWYSLDQNVSLCSSGGDYEVVLYDNKTESISKIINCKKE